VPELKDKTLVLDFTTIAGIYLNNVTRWNDQRIKDLNSADVAAALPDEEIIVVTHNVSSAYTQLFTQLLSQTVPEFAAQVRPTSFFFCFCFLANVVLGVNRWVRGLSCRSRSNRPTDRSTLAPRPTSATS
jgi:ABC-type phosphate transport system substrate-binding protein